MSLTMDSANRQQEYILRSAPIPVRLAGFESSTLKMQQAGWQISIESRTMWAFDGIELCVAFKHDGIKQVALGRMMFEPRHLFNNNMGDFMRSCGIDINYMAPNIRMEIVPSVRSMNFHPIDARPEFMRRECFDLETMGMFKPIKTEDFEIYINQKDEAEILELLLKKQDPKQKEIKQNMKRRAYMDSNDSRDRMVDNINTDVRHQLVLVS